MKKIFTIILFLLWAAILFSVPFNVDTQDKVFHRLARDLNEKLPKSIEIVIYDIFVANGSDEIAKRINENFRLVIRSQQYLYLYRIDFAADLKKEDSKTDFSFLSEYNLEELSAYAVFIKKDAFITANVTVFPDQKRTIWDKFASRFRRKSVALMIGNVFNASTGDSMLRFSYYFIVD